MTSTGILSFPVAFPSLASFSFFVFLLIFLLFHSRRLSTPFVLIGFLYTTTVFDLLFNPLQLLSLRHPVCSSVFSSSPCPPYETEFGSVSASLRHRLHLRFLTFPSLVFVVCVFPIVLTPWIASSVRPSTSMIVSRQRAGCRDAPRLPPPSRPILPSSRTLLRRSVTMSNSYYWCARGVRRCLFSSFLFFASNWAWIRFANMISFSL